MAKNTANVSELNSKAVSRCLQCGRTIAVRAGGSPCSGAYSEITFASHDPSSMNQARDSAARIRFGAFEADLRSGELFKDGRRIPIANQSFLALSVLLEQPGQVVSRDALRARLWPDNRVVEFEQGLNAIINRLREALGDSAGNARFIETLPRRGYRFIAAINAGTDVGAGAEVLAILDVQ